MNELLTPIQIRDMVRKAGITVDALCKDASVARSTFDRWCREETEPTFRAYRKVTGALERYGLLKSPPDK